jgi:hypothetical protein
MKNEYIVHSTYLVLVPGVLVAHSKGAIIVSVAVGPRHEPLNRVDYVKLQACELSRPMLSALDPMSFRNSLI